MAAGDGIDSVDIVDRLASHAKSLGVFDRVTKHEPKNKPGRGLSYALWLNRIEPARGRHGLRYTDARIEMIGRIYSNMLQEPQDKLDTNMMAAADKVFNAYTGDFDLGSEDRFIDLLGITQRDPLKCESGYINIDNMVYRVFTFVIPVVVTNAWEQVQ
jgi:hypothetical protein